MTTIAGRRRAGGLRCGLRLGLRGRPSRRCELSVCGRLRMREASPCCGWSDLRRAAVTARESLPTQLQRMPSRGDSRASNLSGSLLRILMVRES